MCIRNFQNEYIFAAAFEKQPLSNVPKKWLSSEVAIEMRSIVVLNLRLNSSNNTCDEMQLLVDLHVTFPAFEHWCRRNIFHHTILLNNYFCGNILKSWGKVSGKLDKFQVLVCKKLVQDIWFFKEQRKKTVNSCLTHRS